MLGIFRFLFYIERPSSYPYFDLTGSEAIAPAVTSSRLKESITLESLLHELCQFRDAHQASPGAP